MEELRYYRLSFQYVWFKISDDFQVELLPVFVRIRGGNIYAMHLTMSTDYAIRIIVYLSDRKYLASSRELSKNLNIPQSYVFKVLRALQKAGLVKSCSGVDGGFELAKRACQSVLCLF